MTYLGLNFIYSIIDFIESVLASPVEFFQEHWQHPVLWLAFFGAGLAIFHSTYEALKKE